MRSLNPLSKRIRIWLFRTPTDHNILDDLPDEEIGERIKAFVVVKEDVKGVNAIEMKTWCRERLASYKVPHYIEFRDMLPKSKVGKMLRREIRQEELKKR
jgi:long-chain acyl-CoA synthetase